jgi:alpha-galactosidase
VSAPRQAPTTGSTATDALIAAIQANDVARVTASLAKGVNVNATDANGSTPLMQASAAAGTEIVSLLVEKGADIRAVDRDGFSPLLIAAYAGRRDTVSLLLERGASANSADNKGHTALMGAAYSGKSDVVRLLLDKGADVHAKDNENFTPLMVAAGSGNAESVRLLLDAGAEIDAPTKTGFTPLMQAAGTRRTATVSLLLDKGANVNAAAARGATALLVAAYAGSVDVVRLLLDRGADVSAADVVGHTPLIGAAYAGNTEALQLLLARGAKLEEKTKTGFTALMQAAYSGRFAAAKLLLDRGADLSVTTNQGITPLMQAAGTGNAEVLLLLLDYGADVKAADLKGQTAAAWAAKRDHKETLPLLNRASAPSATTTTPASAHLAAYLAPPPSDTRPVIRGTQIVGASPGRPFLFRVPATGKGPLAFSAASLPPGITLDARTGILSGAAAKAGTYRVALAVKGPAGRATRGLTIVCGSGVLARTPPMGWSAWNLYGENVTGEKVRLQADWLVRSGLAAHGYQYVLLDDTWQGRRDTKTGDIDSNRRMGDLTALADYLHAKGLKFGIYSSPNEETCAGYAGSLGHEEQDARAYARWGADYLKYDWCDASRGRRDLSEDELKAAFAKMRAALDKTGRDFVYTINPYGLTAAWQWAKEVGANTYWTSAQVLETWDRIMRNGFDMSYKGEESGQGSWADPGWLMLGKVGSATINPHFVRLTPDEQKAHFSLWCLVAAPLILSCDLTQLDPNAFFPITTAILTNDEVIAIDQDPLGKPARPLEGVGGDAWSRPLADGTIAVGLFNRRPDPRRMTVPWSALDRTGSQPVRDLWLRKDLGEKSESFTATVPSHGVVLVKIGRPKGG